MKLCTPEISWHNRDPIYSIDFQKFDGKIRRIVTSGTDKNVQIWEVKPLENGNVKIEFLSTLTRHTRGVNVVRFSHDGDVLASGGDDSVIMLWKLSDTPTPPNSIFGEVEEENRETWQMFKTLRGHVEDIYDLSWSPTGKYMISGSVDNSAILWDVHKGKSMAFLKEHSSFVQGVAWDPLGKYVATLSCDRCLRIYNASSGQCVNKISKMTPINPSTDNDVKPKSFKMFHDDTMRSFFRRLSFSPDGQLLITPAGCIEEGDQLKNTSYIFTRGSFSKPAVYLPGSSKATLVVRCSPVLYELRKVPRKNKTETEDGAPTSEDSKKEWEKYQTLFCLPYRMVFAIATEDSVLLYDTQQPFPFAFIGNIHYHQLSDLSWSSDGRNLAIASTDGYCSIITFGEEELGIPTKHTITDINKNETEIEKELTKVIDSSDQSLSPSNVNTSVNKTDGAQTVKASLPNGDVHVKSSEKTCAENKTQSSQTKAKKRIQLTSLSVDSSSKLGGSDSKGNSKSHSSPSQDGKEKRRIGLTTLTPKSSDSGKDVEKPSSSKEEASTRGKVEEKTTSKGSAKSSTEDMDVGGVKESENKLPSNDDDSSQSLCLVMETSEDESSMDIMPSSSQGSNASDKSDQMELSKSDSSKQKRRIQLTTLSIK